MSYMRLTALALATLMALGACGKKSDESPTAAHNAASNELLLHVPADTPYLFANLEPVPEDVIDTYLTRLQPLLDSMQAQLSSARTDFESSSGEYPSAPPTRLAHALLVEYLLSRLPAATRQAGRDGPRAGLASLRVQEPDRWSGLAPTKRRGQLRARPSLRR